MIVFIVVMASRLALFVKLKGERAVESTADQPVSDILLIGDPVKRQKMKIVEKCDLSAIIAYAKIIVEVSRDEL